MANAQAAPNVTFSRRAFTDVQCIAGIASRVARGQFSDGNIEAAKTTIETAAARIRSLDYPDPYKNAKALAALAFTLEEITTPCSRVQ
ncbi:MAG: hypothetical protein ACRC46_14715 [Thermoguttaceae bacterium]